MPAFAFAPAFVILAFLWVLAKAPIVAITLAVAWLLRWLIVDFFVAFVAGFGGGLGLRASGVVPRPRGRAQRAISAQELIRLPSFSLIWRGGTARLGEHDNRMKSARYKLEAFIRDYSDMAEWKEVIEAIKTQLGAKHV